MTFIPAVIAWAFTLTFLIALVLVLLDVAGVRRIEDESQRRWLFRSLFASVILAVTGFGTWQFDILKQDARPAAVAADIPPVAPPAPPHSAAPSPPARSDQSAPQPPAQPAEPGALTIPAEVRAWADRALGPRPVLAAVVGGHYPACAAQLRARPVADIALSDARACRQELNRFNDTRLVAYFNLKRPYDHKLEEQGELLGGNGLTSEEVPQFNYVRAEIARLTGEEWDRVVELQQQTMGDIARCARTRCSALRTGG